MFKNERTRAKLTEHCLRTFGTCPFSEVPSEDLIRQDPVPSGPVLSDAQVEGLKKAILATGLSVHNLSQRLGRLRQHSAALTDAAA